MSEIISIDPDNLLEFCRLFTNKGALFILEILLQEKDSQSVYIPKKILQEITQVKDSTFRRFINKIEKLGIPLNREFLEIEIEEEKTDIISVLELVDQVNKKEEKKTITYELLHLPSFTVVLEFGHHEFVVNNNINLPILDLGTLQINSDEDRKDESNLKFLAKSKYKEFIRFLHSLYTSGLFDFDRRVIARKKPITTEELTKLRIKIQNKPLLGTGSLILSELDETDIFRVIYQTGGKSQFELLYGGIKFQIPCTEFQVYKYQTEKIKNKLMLKGQL